MATGLAAGRSGSSRAGARARDGRRSCVPAVRAVARRPARAGRQDGRRLPVHHGQRLQPVGARQPDGTGWPRTARGCATRWPGRRRRRAVPAGSPRCSSGRALARRSSPLPARARGRSLIGDPSSPGGRIADDVLVGADRPGDGVLRPADPGPRALSVPVLRRRRDPRGRRPPLARSPTSSSPLANFANLYAILTPLYEQPGIKDWLGIGRRMRSPASRRSPPSTSSASARASSVAPGFAGGARAECGRPTRPPARRPRDAGRRRVVATTAMAAPGRPRQTRPGATPARRPAGRRHGLDAPPPRL